MRIIENMIPLHCKSLNFHAALLFLYDLNSIKKNTMMFITKYQYIYIYILTIEFKNCCVLL